MSNLDLWFREPHKEQIALSLRTKGTLWSGHSEHQSLDVLDTEMFGRVLVLDGVIMTTERDEFIYHEMIAHVPLFSHPEPRRVLVIGGGDGGAVREAVKHPSVERVDLVEIDRLVVEKSREFLPGIAAALDHPRVQIHYADGIRWVAEHADHYDVIVVDSTDPVGPAVGLFSPAFYRDCARALTERGVLSAQSASPFFDREEVRSIYANLRQAFPVARPYTASVPTYPGGYWCFAYATRQTPGEAAAPSARRCAAVGPLRYYNPEIHAAAFVLPNYVRELLEGQEGRSCASSAHGTRPSVGSAGRRWGDKDSEQ
jgi:spermidine synthase